MSKNYQTAVYYFPNWHVDKDNERYHGKGWTEWELTKVAVPRFADHQQPKIPLWGYEDEADPKAMAKKIDAAADNAIDCFLFDWYWFEDRSFLSRCLEDGFLKAPNNDKIKFAIMYANHKSWGNIHPMQMANRNVSCMETIVDEATFIKATDYCIEKYFAHPSYWRVEGGLYYSFYEVNTLIDSLGGLENTKRILADFRNRVRALGLGELHLNAVLFNVRILENETMVKNPGEILEYLGFDSATSYVWAHHAPMDFPKMSFEKMEKQVLSDCEKYKQTLPVPYYPNATMGWDPSPRTIASDIYGNYGYPFTGILEISPKQFEEALFKLRAYLDGSGLQTKILTINAWNEWTEGSYLEPDMINGYGYLEAIKKVFGE